MLKDQTNLIYGLLITNYSCWQTFKKTILVQACKQILIRIKFKLSIDEDLHNNLYKMSMPKPSLNKLANKQILFFVHYVKF